MILFPYRGSIAALSSVVAYFLLVVLTVRGVGLVGEVAVGWALPTPPVVLLTLDPPVSGAETTGLLQAARTRPTERLVIGSAQVPLAINAYTGGAADWPARAARALTGSRTAGVVTHVALGALLLLLAHRFLTFHGTRIAAGAAAWVLATDWCFVFYRKVLGGTEILLQAAALLVLWALWSRRWKGGVHGTVAIAIGVGLGLAAKVTFAATLLAYGIAVVLTRWDRPELRPPSRVHPGVLLGIPMLCVTPLLLANLHQLVLPLPPIVSHDMLGLQFARLWSGWTGPSPAREGLTNLLYFFGNPVAFFANAYGAEAVAPVSVLRLVGFAATVAGALLEWRTPAKSSSGALLRFLSLAVPLQVALVSLANRDLHHLAQISVPLALLVGLAADRLAATIAPPRSFVRAVATAVFVSPMVLAGALHLANTDRVVSTVDTPSFTEAGQASLVEMLRAEHVTRLVACDYELYGMLEARAPEVAITHAWGARSRGEADGPAILRLASGGWFLAVRASAPMVYNWSPDARKVAVAAAEAGVVATPVASLFRGGSAWATLYRVDPAP
ncbi:MAG: hypothetical protein Q8P41_10795 [Pseudomonadota bacterium]|nr:hypothetical protein [Pseudomonadota bacterium]